ncbi:putative molibdopterin-dependent oxidoreductase YjgC [Arthrobacter sp. UYP6]|uniref:(2Fe-2S)-binding protein n=1 Tax=Arthrobacter sp. UYP6 TaxID=1756378 RepID=UPI003391CB2B
MNTQRSGNTSGQQDPAAVFNGRQIPFAPGQTVGAALVANGIQSWRETRHEGRPRGLFCGIGVCFDCLVSVDGMPNQRACLVEAADGMQVSSSTGNRNRA